MEQTRIIIHWKISYEDIMKDFKNLISICVFCVHKEKDIGWKTTASKLQDPKREFKKLQKKIRTPVKFWVIKVTRYYISFYLTELSNRFWGQWPVEELRWQKQQQKIYKYISYLYILIKLEEIPSGDTIYISNAKNIYFSHAEKYRGNQFPSILCPRK